MNFAEDVSEMSSAQRLKVGAVVVKDDRVISFGYNGTPSGWDNECEERIYISDEEKNNEYEWIVNNYPYSDCGTSRPYKLITKPEVLHAEANALMKLAKTVESGEGAALFLTHSPCMNCAKMIYQAGITSIFFKHRYRDDSGIKFLEKAKLYVEEIKNE